MRDIINDRGNVRPYQTLKCTFDINENLATYAKLERIIPKEWNNFMKGTDCSFFTDHVDHRLRHCFVKQRSRGLNYFI